MNVSNIPKIPRLLIVAIVSLLVVSCISSETSTRRAPESDADAAEQLYNLGAQYYRNEKFELARDRLGRAVELDPKNANAHSLLALTYDKLDNKRLAAEFYEKAVRIAPDNFDVRNAYAIFLCGEDQFDKAQEQFDRAINVRVNDNAEIMMSNAGVCMGNKPDYALAEEYFRSALKTRPTYGEALIQLAALKHKTGDDLPARAFLERYLETNDASASVLYLGVQVESALGDERAATDYSNRIMRDFPDSRESTQLMRSGLVQP